MYSTKNLTYVLKWKNVTFVNRQEISEEAS